MTNIVSTMESPIGQQQRSIQEKIMEKALLLPQLFEKMLCGKAAEMEMNSMANLYTEHGIAVLHLLEDQMSMIPKIQGPQESSPDTVYWKRYGSSDKPIFSYPIAGQIGTQGAVLISTYQKETCDISQFESYMGPPHHHDGVTHITAVTQGMGFFLIAGKIDNEQYLVKVQVKRGDIVFIPENVIHTFFTSSSAFQVVSFTTRLIPTDSSEFLVLTSQDELKKRQFIDYPDFLRKKNSWT